MIKKQLILMLFLFSIQILNAQQLSAFLLNKADNSAVEYANVGVIGKNRGTTSNQKGFFTLQLDSLNNSDTILISCIGYFSQSFQVGSLKNLKTNKLFLEQQIFEISEIVVNPVDYKQILLGTTKKGKHMTAGFKENKLGYEIGTKMHTRKSALLEKINFYVASCSYDSIFYRINVYNVLENGDFENVLKEPIYIHLANSELNNEVSISVEKKNIWVKGDFVVSLEHVRDLGEGHLFFPCGISTNSYIRKTSQGDWLKVPVAICLNVSVMEEK
jgi:hypothetical protein